MEIQTKRHLPIIIGLAMAIFGTLFILLYLFDPPGGHMRVTIAYVGALMILISMFFFAYRNIAILDSTRMIVEKNTQFLLFRRRRMARFSDFKSVGINYIGGGRFSPRYAVVLIGPSNLLLPDSSADYHEACALAKNVADLTNLPVDLKQKTDFLGKRY